MSRDDSILYSGSTSASFTSPRAKEVKDKQEEAKEQRREAGHKLKPSAEIINAILDAEKTLIVQELANLPLNVSTTEENIKELLMALQRHLLFIDRVRNKITIALKEQS